MCSELSDRDAGVAVHTLQQLLSCSPWLLTHCQLQHGLVQLALADW